MITTTYNSDYITTTTTTIKFCTANGMTKRKELQENKISRGNG